MDARKKFLTAAGIFLGGTAVTLLTLNVIREEARVSLAREEGRAMGSSALELQTEEVIGGLAPEEFYVVGRDTVYLKVDDQPVRNYFRR